MKYEKSENVAASAADRESATTSFINHPILRVASALVGVITRLFTGTARPPTAVHRVRLESYRSEPVRSGRRRRPTLEYTASEGRAKDERTTSEPRTTWRNANAKRGGHSHG